MDDNILRQKSRINWLSMGDTNSKYFFTIVKVRKARNSSSLISNSNDEVLTDPIDIQNELIGFYRLLLGRCAHTLPAIDLVNVRSGAKLS